MAFAFSQGSSFWPLRRLPHFLYDSHPPPAHPYLHTTSAFSATLQLYLHPAQFDTADIRYRRLGDTALCCRLGCTAIETAHHVFVQCPAFLEIRGSHLRVLVQATSDLLSAEPPCVGEALCAIARRLFCDDADVWPQVHSMYYLGVLPSLAVICHAHNVGGSHKYGTHYICLAVHIWAEFKHCLHGLSFHLPSTVLHVDLPEHLSYLLQCLWFLCLLSPLFCSLLLVLVRSCLV